MYIVTYIKGCKGCTIHKYGKNTTHGGAICGIEVNLFQTRAISERIPTDARNGVSNRHARQARALIERKNADARHGVRDGYARQSRATRERIIADGRHGKIYNYLKINPLF